MADEEGTVERLEARFALLRELDEMLEQSQREHAPLELTLDRILPLLCGRLDALWLRLKTLDERLDERAFVHGKPSQDDCIILKDIDLAGESLGSLEAGFPGAPAPEERLRLEELLEVGVEVLDNYLKTIHVAREKHFLTRQLHRDLMNPLVVGGIKDAVKTLAKAVRFELLVVIYHQSDAYDLTVRYLCFNGDKLDFDSGADHADAAYDRLKGVPPATAPGATKLLGTLAELRRERLSLRPGDLREDSQTEEFLKELGFDRYTETVLIAGLRDPIALGKIVVTSGRELSTYERDLLGVFSDALQKRVVDFDRESRQLGRSFNVPTVMRLIATEDYFSRYLTPRRRDVAVLFTDISGFTSVSEQILGDPIKVGAFIQAWADGAIAILARFDGVCDKFVGDCLIAHFGPPFFDRSPAEACAAAIDCGMEIARFTKAFPESAAWTAISDASPELGVATGINWCPVSIGSFGLQCGYTAFAPGVNNAARLQGVATRHEILVMDSLKTVLKDRGDYRFGAEQQASVKNVREPLRYHSLLWDCNGAASS